MYDMNVSKQNTKNDNESFIEYLERFTRTFKIVFKIVYKRLEYLKKYMICSNEFYKQKENFN